MKIVKKKTLLASVSAFAIIGLLAGCSFLGTSNSAEINTSETSFDAGTSEAEFQAPKYNISVSDISAILSSNPVSTFCLDGSADAPQISTTKLEDLISECNYYGDVAFMFLDTETGKGIAYNIDAKVYGASSYKAPYALYICEELVGSGKVDLDAPISTYYNYETQGANYLADITSVTDGDPISFDVSVRDYIEMAIVDSDNVAYVTLRQAFDGMGYEEWVEQYDVKNPPFDINSYFPYYSARSSAMLWTEMSLYWEKGSEAAGFLKECCGNTYLSFIGNGLEEGVEVYNKGGWIAEAGYASTCDAGIIDAPDGKTYVMSIMSSMPSGSINQELVSSIAAELFSLRSSLA